MTVFAMVGPAPAMAQGPALVIDMAGVLRTSEVRPHAAALPGPVRIYTARQPSTQTAFGTWVTSKRTSSDMVVFGYNPTLDYLYYSAGPASGVTRSDMTTATGEFNRTARSTSDLTLSFTAMLRSLRATATTSSPTSPEPGPSSTYTGVPDTDIDTDVTTGGRRRGGGIGKLIIFGVIALIVLAVGGVAKLAKGGSKPAPPYGPGMQPMGGPQPPMPGASYPPQPGQAYPPQQGGYPPQQGAPYPPQPGAQQPPPPQQGGQGWPPQQPAQPVGQGYPPAPPAAPGGYGPPPAPPGSGYPPPQPPSHGGPPQQGW
ncbi:hypothetical protein [Actinomadura sp. 9N407]|uniref:hypothetical protein n=1 Tax=Actinomadura sp. 9N407 TaxID=3375154 RepID=UPI00378A6906